MDIEHFQLIDRVLRLDRGAGVIECAATVPKHSSVFEGHFPSYPLMPGTLLVEAMAQTSGYLLLSQNGFERMPLLVQIDKAKIRTVVEPESDLTVYGRLVHQGSGFAVTEGRIELAGKAVAEAQLRFRTMPFPTPELKALVIEHSARVGAA